MMSARWEKRDGDSKALIPSSGNCGAKFECAPTWWSCSVANHPESLGQFAESSGNKHEWVGIPSILIGTLARLAQLVHSACIPPWASFAIGNSRNPNRLYLFIVLALVLVLVLVTHSNGGDRFHGAVCWHPRRSRVIEVCLRVVTPLGPFHRNAVVVAFWWPRGIALIMQEDSPFWTSATLVLGAPCVL
jgi:hypothetical protein